MNKVTVNSEEIPLPPWTDSFCSFALKVLDEIKRDSWCLSVLLCGDKTITDLNTRYRSKAEPTDILSFNLGTETEIDGKTFYLPGDIVISLESMRENAQYFKTSEDEELRRLLIHGILHLDGMDHKTLDKSEPMLALQEDLLKNIKNVIMEENREKPLST